MLPWRRKRGRTPDPPASEPPASEPPVPKPDPDHRIYAIGDVHGRHDLLEVLLGRLRADAVSHDDDRQPVLVFLGDLVDRGDHTREVLDLALEALVLWPRTVFLFGNHEAALLSFLESPVKGASWLGFGGRQTLASYGIPAPGPRPDAAALHDVGSALGTALGHHRGFLRDMERLFVSGNVVFSHAGIDPALPLHAQPDSALLWGQSAFLEQGPPEGLRAVHGHWDDYAPVVTPRRICVDTGAYYSGRLTAVRLDEATELFAVDGLDL